MNTLQERIQGALSSTYVEACEVVILYNVLRGTWNEECGRRMAVVSDSFRRKIAMKRTKRQYSSKTSGSGPVLVFDLDLEDIAACFNERYFAGEKYWNPALPGVGASRSDRSDRMAAISGAWGEKKELLRAYFARTHLGSLAFRSRSFSGRFFLSYHLICQGKYGKAKEHLKLLLLFLKINSEEILRKVQHSLFPEENAAGSGASDRVSLCEEAAKRTCIDHSHRTGGFLGGEVSKAWRDVGGFPSLSREEEKLKKAEMHISHLRLHIYNLVSFCHFYLGEYEELSYYLGKGAKICKCSAFSDRIDLVEFVAGRRKEVPKLDVWIAEVSFIGEKGYLQNFEKIEGFSIWSHFGGELFARRAGHIRAAEEETTTILCGSPCDVQVWREVDTFLWDLVEKHNAFTEKRLLLNIFLKNEVSVLRELINEPEIDIDDPSFSILKKYQFRSCYAENAYGISSQHAEGPALCHRPRRSSFCILQLPNFDDSRRHICVIALSDRL